jgi:hypothetical protein
MTYSSTPQDDRNYDIAPASDNSQRRTYQGISLEMARLEKDGMLVLSRIVADYQAQRDAEETKRIEIEAYYRERMESHSRELDVLVEKMREASENQRHYVDTVFAYANRLLDTGFPELSVHVYELFVDDSTRRNIMEYLIEYHRNSTLGRIKLQKKPVDGI